MYCTSDTHKYERERDRDKDERERERARERERYNPPKNGVIALWPNTLVVKCKYCVSQKRNEANTKSQWLKVLLTFILKFTVRS